MDIKTISARFKQANVPLDRDDTWTVQRATVIKHAALERLAAGCDIQFDPPQVLRATADECVMIVTGRMGEKAEWSIGEARAVLMRDTGKKNQWGKPVYEAPPDTIGNYQITPKQAAYPYAMAEKRAKDRVIIKLVGLHGVYSSEEADAFREGGDKPEPAKPAQTRVTSGQPSETPFDAPSEAQEKIARVMKDAIRMAESRADLDDWLHDNRAELDKLPEALRDQVRDAYKRTLAALRQPQQEAAE